MANDASKKQRQRHGRGGQPIKRFPMVKIQKLLQMKFPRGIVKPEAAIYLTAVLEYLAVEIIERSANVANSRRELEKKGNPEMVLDDVLEAVQSDDEMRQLIDRCRQGNAKEKS